MLLQISCKMAFITTYWVLDSLIVLTTLMIAAYFYMTRKFKYWKKQGVMELTPIPFLGNLMDFHKKSPGQFIKYLYDEAKGSPYIGFYILDKPRLLICDRELVKNILVKDFNYFSNRYSMPDSTNDRLGYANLFFITNPAWKALRTKLTPIFTSGKLKKMYELMHVCSDNLDTYLDSLELEGKGKEIEMKDVAAKFATDIIGSTAYGLNVNSLNNPDAEFRKYGKMIFDYENVRGYEMFAIFFLPSIVRMAGIKVFGKESTIFLRKVFWETINQRMESGENRNDLIDILIDLKKTYSDQDINGFKFDGDDLVAQAAIFFTGGFETSSTTISFTLYKLAVHFDIQSKLRKEICDAIEKNNGRITYDMILSLPYLDKVVSETLRMYPLIPFLDRVAVDNYKVPNSNLVIEKDMPVYISMLGMHYDPKYFPDPEKFDPERFTEEKKRERPPFVYFPFGEGPRICIGARLGLLQTKLALIKILSRFEVSPSEKTLIPMVLDPKTPITSPIGGSIYLNIRKIN